MDHRRLTALLTAMAPLALATGCSSSLGDFDAEICLRTAPIMADIEPAADLDYVALRGGSPIGDFTASPLSTWGEACATASDEQACLDALLAAPISSPGLVSGWGQAYYVYDVATTAGDSVAIVDELDELLAVLDAVDTPGEAVLVASAAGHEIQCGEPNYRAVDSGYLLYAYSGDTCGGDKRHYEIWVDADGNVTETGNEFTETGNKNCAIGRRPETLASAPGMAREVGEFFANAAHLEAASVPAFIHLARELRAHGAPRQLVRGAWRACADEIRHARATAALARRFGSVPRRPHVGRQPIRSLFDVASDNAQEGCVRETLGAAVAFAQARSAADPMVRRALAPIARDEARHAQLSWAVAAWAESRLRPRERRQLRDQRAQAAASVKRESEVAWSPAIQRVAGMPSVDGSMRLLQGLEDRLFTKRLSA